MDWKDAVNYGLPTVLLLGLVYSLAKLALWLRDNVVTPLVSSHLSLTNTLAARIPEQCKKLDALVGAKDAEREAHERGQQAIQAALEEQTSTLRACLEEQTRRLSHAAALTREDREASQVGALIDEAARLTASSANREKKT